MKNEISRTAPIGVFDSGLGGLTVVRELMNQLPNEHIVYFGDIARLPYGIKSDEQIREFSFQNTEFLLNRHVKAIVIACNSSSSAAYPALVNRYNLPIFDVIGPASEEAASKTRNNRVGIIGTQATVEGGAYQRKLKEANPKIRVYAKACPLLVSVVEEGILNTDLTRIILKRYLAPLLEKNIDTLILGCTHYPLLRMAIQDVVGKNIKLVDSAPATSRKLKLKLETEDLLNSRHHGGKLEVCVSDVSRNFIAIASRFLGRPIGKVHVVRLKNEITVNGKWV